MCAMFEPQVLRGMPFPMLEDLLSQPPFCEYGHWLRDTLTMDQVIAGRKKNMPGMQWKVLDQREAPEPLISWYVGKDEHFAMACSMECSSLPLWDRDQFADVDLEFAAAMTVAHAQDLRGWRRGLLSALRELHYRCATANAFVRERLGKHQRDIMGH